MLRQSVLQNMVTNKSADALADTAYYLKLYVKYGFGALEPELTIRPAENEVPVLKELTQTG